MPRFKGDLPERTFQFGLRILRLTSTLPNTQAGWVVARQLMRCGTSIGANVREADGALTEREFTQLCNIARREAGETCYWLRLSCEGGLINPQETVPCADEAAELARILATIVRKMQIRTSASRSRSK